MARLLLLALAAWLCGTADAGRDIAAARALWQAGGGGGPAPAVLGPTLPATLGMGQWGSFFAALGYNDEGYDCGGALIADNVVLTAGHCLWGDGQWWTPDWVRLGWADLRTRPCTPGPGCPLGGEEWRVSRTIIHPDFKASDKETRATSSDLALLVLTGRSRLAPATLPPARLAARMADSWVVWTGGYSYTPGPKFGTTLNCYATHYNTPATCVRKAAALPADWFQPLGRPPQSNKTVCTGGQGMGQGTCTHDSGSPLLYSQLLPWGKRRHSLLGVLSWGVGEGGGWGGECSQGATAMDWWAGLLHPAHRQWLAQQLAALGHQALVDSWNALR